MRIGGTGDIYENDLFYIAANYTNVSDMEKSSGVCNFTAPLGDGINPINISAHYGSNNNINLTTSINLTLQITESNSSLSRDNYAFKICKTNLTASPTVELWINNIMFDSVSGNIIPYCNYGSYLRSNFTKYWNNVSQLNVTLKCSGCNANSMLQINPIRSNEGLYWNREFWTYSKNLTWNATSKLYEYKGTQFTFTSSNYSQVGINIQCNDSTAGGFGTLFAIKNYNLSLNILSINNISYYAGMTIDKQYYNTILGEILNDTYTQIEFNVTKSGVLIKSVQNTPLITLNISDLAQSGLYNISLYAKDDENNGILKTGNFIIVNNMTLFYPVAGSSQTANPLNFTFTTNFYYKNCSLYSNITTSVLHEIKNITESGTPFVNSTINYNMPLGIDDDIQFYIKCYDNYNESFNTQLTTIHYFSAAPENIYIYYPINDFNYSVVPLNFTIMPVFDFYKCDLYTNFSGGFTNISSFGNTYNPTFINGHFTLNETSGTAVQDSSPQNMTCTATNTESGDWMPAKINYGIDLDGVNEYITCGAANHYNYEYNDKFSIDGWVKTNTTGDAIISRSTSTKGWMLYIDAGGLLYFYLAVDNTINSITKKSNGIVNNDAWHYIAVTYDGSGLASGVHFYIDNILSDGVVVTNNLAGSTAVSANLQLGARANSLTYKGMLDEFAIYNYTLTENERTARFNATYGTEQLSVYNITLKGNLNYTNLSHTIPPNTHTDIEYYVMCNSTNSTLYNSSIITIHYNNDFTPPMINVTSPIIAAQSTHFNSDIDINFTTNEFAYCSINTTKWSLRYSNNSVFSYNTTNISNGYYYINISCNDSGGYQNNTILNFTIDKTIPVITWIMPDFYNTTQGMINVSFFLDMKFEDENLFAYYVGVYDINGDLRYNFSHVNIPSSPKYLLTSITPDLPNVWTILAIAYDSHTAHAIPEYEHDIDNSAQKISFNIDVPIDHDANEVEQKNVSIKYTGATPMTGININKEIDRYTFDYSFAVSLPDKPEIEDVPIGIEEEEIIKDDSQTMELKFRLECPELYYVKNSEYKAHFVCWGSKNWVDFENHDIIGYTVKSCPYPDCYDIKLTMPKQKEVQFSSIGELNSVTNVVTFEVLQSVPVPTVNNTLIIGACPVYTSQFIMLFIIITMIMGCVIISLMYHQPVLTVIAGIAIIGCSLYIIGCSEFLGFVLMAIGIIIALLGSVRLFTGKRR